MRCPGCDRAAYLHDIQATGWRWCSQCGTAVEVVNGKTGVVLRPEPVKASASAHFDRGSFLIAALRADLRRARRALNRANLEMMKIDPNSTWTHSPPVDAIEALIEGVTAIVHELDAREDDGADANRVVQKMIADGVAAVEEERTRIAKLVLLYRGSSGSVDSVLERVAENIRTNKVPK